MSRRVNVGVRTAGAAMVASCFFLLPGLAAAQTTVVIDNPQTQVADARIRGGSYANTVFNKVPLATKKDPSSSSNNRRSVLKFDTHHTVPAGATVTSAKITLTISAADAGTRTLGLYRLGRTFDNSYVTWNTRKSGTRWVSSGGDVVEKFAQASVGSTVGSKVTFDVTSLVQNVVKAKYGSSRYTRVALIDLGSAATYSYKEFYSTEASDPAKRPVLKVVYGGGTTATDSDPDPTPVPSTTTGSRLKVLHWNTHYGVGTDGKYSIDRIATYIAKFNPDLVSLNEVTRYAYYNTSEDQASRYAALLKSKTGRTWYWYYRVDSGASKGVGNLVLSRFPLGSTSYCQLSTRRVAVNAGVHVNGRLINFWSTHLDSSSGNSLRITEVKRLLACSDDFAQQRMIAGDFNAQASSSEIGNMKNYYVDAWSKAASGSDAISYPGNTSFGATRNSRIDYQFYSVKAGSLVLKGAQVFDTRDSSGRMPSDHKPLLVTYEVQ